MGIYPDLGTLGFCFPEHPPWKFSQILALWVFTFQNTPPPSQKWKFSQILALWVFTFKNTPPPLKMEIWPDLGTLGFHNSRTPPPHGNLARFLALWGFTFQNTPPPSRKWKSSQILELWSIWRLLSCIRPRIPSSFNFGGHLSFLWGHWYPYFGLLVTSARPLVLES